MGREAADAVLKAIRLKMARASKAKLHKTAPELVARMSTAAPAEAVARTPAMRRT
jgi:hypothetical protein